jgi:hypothetical protein
MNTLSNISRRGLLQLASGLLVPAHPRERAYSFTGGWYGADLIGINGVWRPLLQRVDHNGQTTFETRRGEEGGVIREVVLGSIDHLLQRPPTPRPILSLGGPDFRVQNGPGSPMILFPGATLHITYNW